MANPVVINALLTKKAELLADAEKLCEQLDALYEDIAHVDGTLELLGHTVSGTLIPRHRRPTGMFKQGELIRFLFERLRAHGAQTSSELRDAIIAHKNIDPDDQYARRLAHKKVCLALTRQEKRGTVVRDGEAWRVA